MSKDCMYRHSELGPCGECVFCVIDGLRARAERAEAENKRLRKALRTLTLDENWGPDGGWIGKSYPDEIARAALGEEPTP